MSINPFKQIAIRELPTWIKTLQLDGVSSKTELLNELNLIDDLLTLQKSKSLLNRKKNLRQQLEARISVELGHRTQQLNRK